MSLPTGSAPSLAPWQWSFNGYVFGDNCTFDPDVIGGVTDLPGIQSGDIKRAREHGELAGIDLSTGRDVVLSGSVVDQTGAIQTSVAALAAATVPQLLEVPLWFNLPPYGVLGLNARCRRRSIPLDVGYTLGISKVDLGFHATDPRWYGNVVTSSPIGLPTPAGGMTFPATFPLSFGGGSSSATVSINNAGNVESRPVLVLTGPVTNPWVGNAATGWLLNITNPSQSSFTLYAGDTLTIDLASGAVSYKTAGSTISTPRKYWIVAGSIWPSLISGIGGLAPGANTIQFGSQDSGSVAGTLAIKSADAYFL